MNVDTTPFIGIVTVLYNADEVLPDFFASLAAQEGIRYRLYVIDNGSTGSGTALSEQLAREHGIDAVCVFNDANLGVAKGNNQGIERALADGCTHVLLSNNDTAFGPRTVIGLLDAMRATGSVAATPKIMIHSRPEMIWYAGGHISGLMTKTPHYGEYTIDTGRFDQQQYTGYAPTCFMLLERRVFDVVGMMDERYFVYYDDTDFVWRMARAGIRIRYVPESVVLHKVSTSTGGERSPFTVYYANRNRIYFIRKNMRGMQAIAALAYVLLTRIPSALALPRPVASRLWAGVRDGFQLPTTPNDH